MSANEVAASELDRSNKTESSTVVGSLQSPDSNVGSEVRQVQRWTFLTCRMRGGMFLLALHSPC